jgi:rare lipoprotein A
LTSRTLTAVFAALALYGCERRPTPSPHYVVGSPYQAAGFWHYPQEADGLDDTGIASIQQAPAGGLTSDGELFDGDAMAGAHATLQLPAIARVTNLENGRQVVIRINDRGSGDPHRLIEVTPRVATLLQFPDGGLARVRLELLPTETQTADEALGGGTKVAVAAPRSSIEVTQLPPIGTSAPGATTVIGAPSGSAPTAVPLRLPETVLQGAASPGQLIVRLDTFEQYQFASVQLVKMAGTGAHIVYVTQGRTTQFRVDCGPLSSIAQADAVLDRAFAYGIPDARIVVE